jgi:hypothetical protein
VHIRDKRPVSEQVKSGLRLAGWVLLTLAVALVLVRSDMALLDRNAGSLYRIAGACGLLFAAILMFVSIERWGKWFVGALAYWTLRTVFPLLLHPTTVLLQYMLLFIIALGLCARFELSHGSRSALEKFGMVIVVVALSFSLTLGSPVLLLIGVSVLGLTQLISHFFIIPQAQLPRVRE